MRVTEALVFRNATLQAARAQERLQQAVQAASSGLRVTHPGDDPAAAAQMVTNGDAALRFAALGTSSGRASDELGVVDGALASVGDVLRRAKEIAVQTANDTLGAAERAGAAKEVEGLFQQALAALNTKTGDRFVFGGTRDDAPPFDGLGGYLGDTNVRRLEIAPGVLLDVSVRADLAIQGSGGGTDVLATLKALQTALQGNSVTQIQATIDALTRSVSQVAGARSGAGSAQTVLDAARTASKVSQDAATKRVHDLGDADAIEAASQLALAQRALESALTAAQMGLKLSILDIPIR